MASNLFANGVCLIIDFLEIKDIVHSALANVYWFHTVLKYYPSNCHTELTLRTNKSLNTIHDEVSPIRFNLIDILLIRGLVLEKTIITGVVSIHLATVCLRLEYLECSIMPGTIFLTIPKLKHLKVSFVARTREGGATYGMGNHNLLRETCTSIMAYSKTLTSLDFNAPDIEYNSFMFLRDMHQLQRLKLHTKKDSSLFRRGIVPFDYASINNLRYLEDIDITHAHFFELLNGNKLDFGNKIRKLTINLDCIRRGYLEQLTVSSNTFNEFPNITELTIIDAKLDTSDLFFSNMTTLNKLTIIISDTTMAHEVLVILKAVMAKKMDFSISMPVRCTDLGIKKHVHTRVLKDSTLDQSEIIEAIRIIEQASYKSLKKLIKFEF